MLDKIILIFEYVPKSVVWPEMAFPEKNVFEEAKPQKEENRNCYLIIFIIEDFYGIFRLRVIFEFESTDGIKIFKLHLKKINHLENLNF
jgi:hypothetical protein